MPLDPHATRVLAAAIAAMAIFLAPAAPADACSGTCESAYARPRAGSLPANAGGVWLNPGRAYGRDDYDAVLRVSDGDVWTVLAHEDFERSLAMSPRYAIRPSTPLVPGTTLSLEVTGPCPPPEETSKLVGSWTITAPIPMPSALGTLTVVTGSSPTAGQIGGGAGCDESFPAAYADISLEVDTSAEPWTDAMVFETLVNGEVYRPYVSLVTWRQADRGEGFGGSWRGRGVDRVFYSCDDLAPRVISMRGILPDGTVLETPGVEVALECSRETRRASRDAGVSTNPGADAGVGSAAGGACATAPTRARRGIGAFFVLAMAALALTARTRVRR